MGNQHCHVSYQIDCHAEAEGRESRKETAAESRAEELFEDWQLMRVCDLPTEAQDAVCDLLAGIADKEARKEIEAEDYASQARVARLPL